MLKEKKVKPTKRNPSVDDNGAGGEILSLLQGIAKKQQEIDERLEELEEGGQKGAAALRMVNLLYDTDDAHLPGLTRLGLHVVKPFALEMTLNALTSEEVLSGKVSLPQVFNRAYFSLMRSVGSEHLKRGAELAGEQAATEQEKGAEMDLGENR